MSAICAVWSRTSRAVDPGVVNRMSAPLRSRGVETLDVDRGAAVVAFDGRLDDRDALRRAVGAPADADDASLVTAAYREWGTRAFVRLLGDFAVVLWDARLERLVCARDVMGVRPLCYATGRDGSFLVASELRALLASGLVDRDINEARALEHLVDRGQHREETLYRSIRRLPPAHVLVATVDAITVERYWDFDTVSSVRHRTDTEYAEHARDLIGSAVRDCARGSGRVGVLLSGGVDSSVIAAIAASEGIDCEAFTIGFPDDARDESAYARAVAAAAGIPIHVIPYRPMAREWYRAQAREFLDLPDYPNGSMLDAARLCAASRGIRVLLTGVGGDEWFTGSPYQYADWLKQGAIPSALKRAVSDSRHRGWSQAGREALLCGVWPLLPKAIRSTLKRARGRRDTLPPWIGVDAGRRTNLLARVSARVQARPGETFARADTRALATSGFQVHSEEMEDRAAARCGIEQRNPLYDRRVIEFAFGLPEEQRWRGGMGKAVLRNAAHGLVPDVVLRRRDKAEFSDTFIEALPAGPLTFPRLSERGWIDPAVVATMYHDLQAWRATRDARYFGLLGPFWMLHAVESWLSEVRDI